MLGHLQLLAANGGPRINANQFHSPPAYLVLFMFSIAVMFAIMRWGKMVTPEGSEIANAAVNVLALLFMATAVAALTTTTKISNLMGLIQSLENTLGSGLARHGVQFGASALAIALVLAAGFWYNSREGLVAAVVFGILFLVLCYSSPGASHFIGWFIDNIVSLGYNWSIDFFTWLNT